MGVFQINAKGIQDNSLIRGIDNINFFKQVYKPFYNFSIEKLKLFPNDTINFNRNVSFKFKNLGDMLHKIYFCFSLPVLTPVSGTYAGWTNSVGHAIIKQAQITTNGQIIDTIPGIFLEVHNELTTNNPGDEPMIGKYIHPQSTYTNAEFVTNYTVSLPFWFCKHLSSSFPLSALYFSDLTLKLTLNDFDDCIVYDGNVPPNTVDITDAYLLSEYIYLDNEQREIMRSSSHNHIISQTQSLDKITLQTSGVNQVDVTFNHPVYEMFFVIVETASETNNDWFNFSIRNPQLGVKIQEFIKSAKLITDGIEKTDYFEPSHVLSIVNSRRYHTNPTDKYIYIMSFCDAPENAIQPTGYLNFSVIDNVNLFLKLNGTIPTSNFYAFALNWNWITIENGNCYVKYFS